MNVYVITGSSGSGKTTIVNKLKDEGVWEECISHTTRKIREHDGEKDGFTYYYISDEKFEEMKANGEFVETVVYHGNKYGLSHAEVNHVSWSGSDVVVIADYDGYKQIKESIPHCIGIFIDISKLDSLLNMIDRRDNTEVIAQRISTYEEENENKLDFDHIVVNERGKMDDATLKIQGIISMHNIVDKLNSVDNSYEV